MRIHPIFLFFMMLLAGGWSVSAPQLVKGEKANSEVIGHPAYAGAYSFFPGNAHNGGQELIRLEPGPTGDVLSVRVNPGLTITAEIAIFDGAGQLVYLAMPDQRELFLAELPAGVYFLETQVDDQRVTRRFVRL